MMMRPPRDKPLEPSVTPPESCSLPSAASRQRLAAIHCSHVRRSVCVTEQNRSAAGPSFDEARWPRHGPQFAHTCRSGGLVTAKGILP
jgi:hypothetical protein